MYDYKYQTVIVTGGTRGIGKAIAESFLKAGARVVVTYTANEAAAAQFKQDSGQFIDHPGNAPDPPAAPRPDLRADVVKHWNPNIFGMLRES